ncbi:uncharacterized protein LOC120113663 [Hibiscus syriacus]|uniref:uncharacterized protein LOC120113663 n=1 Tax=Hibiscus syriacus TaxID=106335 RepID=UPI001921E96A|nr:uncharacterized protein LOC120113663 [Hibiscus syriacus]
MKIWVKLQLKKMGENEQTVAEKAIKQRKLEIEIVLARYVEPSSAKLENFIPFSRLVDRVWLFSREGVISSFVVTLDSIEIFRSLGWISTPTVYFVCKGENKTLLPDVTKPGVVYSFRGQESWQPLTQLDAKKCKRCGFYEQDIIKIHDVYDEREFCAFDFKPPFRKYKLFKEKQLNATFHCLECASLSGASNATPQTGDDDDGKGMHVFMIILITMLVLTVTIIALVAAHKRWQKKKRQQEQAQFLKLFEEGDDIEAELGYGTII